MRASNRCSVIISYVFSSFLQCYNYSFKKTTTTTTTIIIIIIIIIILIITAATIMTKKSRSRNI